MTIGELARAAAVPVSTLRFYERRGLLPPAARTRSGYRTYEVRDVERVRFLRRAAELGFTVRELRLLLRLSSATTIRRTDVVRIGEAKLAELDERIADLQGLRDAVAQLLAEPCLDPAAPCPIVAALASRPPARLVRGRRAGPTP
jgi:MerR family mercuric resistance operon transcriptional regulator